ATPSEIIRMMVGRVLDHLYPPKASRVGEWVFELRGLTARPKLDGVNLGVRRGEILGLAGLIGSGRTEAMLAAGGPAPRDGGEIWLDGNPVHIESQQAARAHGIIYSPEDRKEKGLFLAQGVRANIVAAALAACSRHGLMNRAAEKALSRALVGD